MPFSSPSRTSLPPVFARGLAGFRSRTPPPLHPSGVAQLDSALGGGFPRGALVEVCGPLSSGRTSLGLALLAQATKRGEACAFIDVSDSLDPMSLSAAGVEVSQLLWIRCGEEAGDNSPKSAPSSNPVNPLNAQKNASKFSEQSGEKQTRGFFWQHPREQMRGLEASFPELMRKKEPRKKEPAGLHETRATTQKTHIAAATKWMEEQVEADRRLPRRGGNIRRPFSAPPSHNSKQLAPLARSYQQKPWERLEQALKAADLLLHSNGWGVVVFDLGDVSRAHARRIPLSTWFRFQRVIENTPAILLLLVEESCAKSCASVVLRCQRLRESWNSTACTNGRPGPATLQGFEIQGEIIRSRTHLMACHSAFWETHTV